MIRAALVRRRLELELVRSGMSMTWIRVLFLVTRASDTVLRPFARLSVRFTDSIHALPMDDPLLNAFPGHPRPQTNCRRPTASPLSHPSCCLRRPHGSENPTWLRRVLRGLVVLFVEKQPVRVWATLEAEMSCGTHPRRDHHPPYNSFLR